MGFIEDEYGNAILDENGESLFDEEGAPIEPPEERTFTVSVSSVCNTVFEKTSNDLLDYMINWATWLTTNNSDTISSNEWIVPEELTVVLESNTETYCIIWLSGGEDGIVYPIISRITTALGRVKEQTFYLRIEEK